MIVYRWGGDVGRRNTTDAVGFGRSSNDSKSTKRKASQSIFDDSSSIVMNRSILPVHPKQQKKAPSSRDLNTQLMMTCCYSCQQQKEKGTQTDDRGFSNVLPNRDPRSGGDRIVEGDVVEFLPTHHTDTAYSSFIALTTAWYRYQWPHEVSVTTVCVYGIS